MSATLAPSNTQLVTDASAIVEAPNDDTKEVPEAGEKVLEPSESPVIISSR
jgi:hypothetical protein